MSITKRQKDVLNGIHQFLQDFGYPPTVRELGEIVNLTSVSTVHGHLQRLEASDYIRRDATKPRAIEITPKGYQVIGAWDKVPFLGSTEEPILDIDNATKYYNIPEGINYQSNELFMLEIKDDSMINIGILPGDTITVKSQDSASDGEIIVAKDKNNKATCRTFYEKEDYFILQAENDNLDDVILNKVNIIGKVVGLSRKYN